MFDFGKAITEQKDAIQCVDGPLLIIAGPGTGKTFTIIQRAIYMIEERGVKPEQIMLVTYTEKAAKELVTRITNELADRSIPVNINDMYIGTFHSLCLRFIEENAEYTGLKKNFRPLDGSFEQVYMVLQNLKSFLEIDKEYLVIKKFINGKPANQWKKSTQICTIVNNLTEELVDCGKLIEDKDEYISVTGRIYQRYLELLEENNCIDFSGMQSEAYKLLKNNPNVLAKIHDRIKYIMVDEYQDTNYIQEQLLFLLAGEAQNLCVVGDDDQGLYRFRGATIRNILEFPDKFKEVKCEKKKLVVNHRSDSGIIDFYNKWMNTTEESGFSWGKFRFEKTIEPEKPSTLSSPSVVKISACGSSENWQKETLDFINMLKSSGKVTDLNQIAFLFYSVKSRNVVALARYLEANGINVYSPRAKMFFEREEIKLLLGCLISCFPSYKSLVVSKEKYEKLPEGQKVWRPELNDYYFSCLKIVDEFLKKPEGRPLAEFIKQYANTHSSLSENTDYAFTGIAYRLFGFEPFKTMLNTELDSGVIDLRPSRNLSKMTEQLGRYEYIHDVDVFTAKGIKYQVNNLFNTFLYYLRDAGIDEYEDDSEYAPSGCVSFLTMHQSKGLEFPVVIVGSLNLFPDKYVSDDFEKVEQKYYRRRPFEPNSYIKQFDFRRLYYTAFSRAQNLLVLTAWTGKGLNRYFEKLFNETADWRDRRFDINEFTFAQVKDVNLKEAYSFTSHIAVYEECPLQYKFFKELSFPRVRIGATLFGTLVHQTIEDIHRAVLRDEEHLITEENISSWLESNYRTISKKEHMYINEPQRRAACRQVIRYAESQKNNWDRIREAEVDISLVKPNYILKGTIDLIRGEGDTVEIVDFKSEKKPDPAAKRVEHYRQQMQVYAHLVEQKTGSKVSKLHLYYTGDDSGDPTLTFDNDRKRVEETIREFDSVVDRIQKKDFSGRTGNKKTCDSCDFRYYCDRTSDNPAERGGDADGSAASSAAETAKKKTDSDKYTRYILPKTAVPDLQSMDFEKIKSGYRYTEDLGKEDFRKLIDELINKEAAITLTPRIWNLWQVKHNLIFYRNDEGKTKGYILTNHAVNNGYAYPVKRKGAIRMSINTTKHMFTEKGQRYVIDQLEDLIIFTVNERKNRLICRIDELEKQGLTLCTVEEFVKRKKEELNGITPQDILDLLVERGYLVHHTNAAGASYLADTAENKKSLYVQVRKTDKKYVYRYYLTPLGQNYILLLVSDIAARKN